MTYEPTNMAVAEHTAQELAHALDELDRVIHRSKALLQRVQSSPVKQPKKDPWEAVKGMWKGRDIGDAVHYQRQVRDEWNDHVAV